jgi:hypothetical protein
MYLNNIRNKRKNIGKALETIQMEPVKQEYIRYTTEEK